ncbi:MAG: Ig-like domain-containing protein, partial [Lachnospiraceae bacterium]|nr:Ig-like domain-containing protein [Lachnospiraceae bacterium]
IPLSSYAATISQPASGLAVTVEEGAMPELTTSPEDGNSEGAGNGETVIGEISEEPSGNGNGVETENSTGDNNNTETDSGSENDSSAETEDGSGTNDNTETDSETETDNSTETGDETETANETETESEIETEDETETEIETETETEIETETESETEEDEAALLEEQLQALMQEAKGSLKGITASEYVMALVYLCDSYEVKAQPSFDAQTVAVLKSGHTVFIKDVEVSIETGTVWYQASFVMDEKEYTGYISRDYLAYSNESFLSWEELYIEPVVQLCQKNITQADYALDSNAANSYSNDISQFPESYRAALQTLKNSHPNWTFVKFDTGLNWDEVVANEMVGARSLVHKSAKDAWKREVYAQDNNWYYATEGALRYCLDPRNGFTESRIFQFEQLTFNESYHSVNAIQGILNNTFMKGNVPQLSISYAQDFYNIGKNRKISPFHLASRVLQEQGVNGGSALISGTYTGYNNQYYGYYNYFNIGATSADPIQTGLKYAKEKGWNTPHKSLEGGAASIGNSYILQGQDTLYLQKFDVESQYNGLYYHQYMQNIQAPASEASTIRNLYNQAGALNGNFVFKVPTYNNMPASACPDPSLETIKLSATSVSLKGGYDTTVTYSISGTNASQSKVTWKVEDTSIVKAEQVDGKQEVKITALKAGTTNIKFTSSNGATANCKVTVVKDTIVLSKSSLSINAGMSDGSTPGETLEITYTINNPKSSVSGCKADKPELLEVEILSEEVDTANNTIKGTIRLKALAPGEVKLTLTSKYSGSAVCTVTVVRLPEQLKMEGPVTVSVGNSKHVNCEVLPEDTTNKNLKWSSSDEKIVTVNPSTGRITGVGTGTATLTATTEEKSLAGQELTATCEVTVVASVAYVEIAREEAELLLNEETAETFSMDGKIYLYQNLNGEPVLQETSGQNLYDIIYT